jgi:hypothetical protein
MVSLFDSCCVDPDPREAQKVKDLSDLDHQYKRPKNACKKLKFNNLCLENYF